MSWRNLFCAISLSLALLLLALDPRTVYVVAGRYVSFDVVTESSLKHAAAEMDVKLPDNEIAALMSDYCRLLP